MTPKAAYVVWSPESIQHPFIYDSLEAALFGAIDMFISPQLLVESCDDGPAVYGYDPFTVTLEIQAADEETPDAHGHLASWHYVWQVWDEKGKHVASLSRLDIDTWTFAP